jgi:hypothetical protein
VSFVVKNFFAEGGSSGLGQYNKHITRLPTARFFKVVLPAKMSYDIGCLAGPVAGDMQRWAKGIDL